jgi:hypothetical protein
MLNYACLNMLNYACLNMLNYTPLKYAGLYLAKLF